MGCTGSSSKGQRYSVNDFGPDGPLEDAPPQLLVRQHPGMAYNGLYQRLPEPWNGKAAYRNQNGRVLYFYAENEGGAAGWAFDHRDQSGTTRGAKDWCDGGWMDLRGGLAYPPIGAGMPLLGLEERVTILELEPALPPASLTISEHPGSLFNGIYMLAPDLWNMRPHYHHTENTCCFYYYAANEEGCPGWSLHPVPSPGGQKDWCGGGWIGPYIWAHPPAGTTPGCRGSRSNRQLLNGVGFVSVQVNGLGDTAVAASVHAQMIEQHRALLSFYGHSTAPTFFEPEC